ncbi:hypothetical protein LSTR_LSTR016316 [Laodelphax striatellus]|uniref:Uncharacterized protein n=1 Tax=Laodelphax striatellus TaxID=195883 RepID=A0A482X3I4_LAOST|nr:hypothetical protein LSTR_LSTR016316 [Laodelphax striatellus]
MRRCGGCKQVAVRVADCLQVAGGKLTVAFAAHSFHSAIRVCEPSPLFLCMAVTHRLLVWQRVERILWPPGYELEKKA